MLHHKFRHLLLGLGALAILLLGWPAVPGSRAADASAAAASAPNSPQSDAGTTPGKAESAPPQTSSSHYIIGPGDTLQVFVWRNPDLSTTVPVRPDGRISTPLVQNMVAVGKTPAQLAHDMEKVLSEYLRSPTVNIIVTQPLGALTQIKVIGQVAHPEAIPFHQGMKVLDAVLAAGGLTEYAAGNRAKIVRTRNGKTVDIRVKLENLMQKGDIKQNLALEPGDVIVVPQSLF